MFLSFLLSQLLYLRLLTEPFHTLRLHDAELVGKKMNVFYWVNAEMVWSVVWRAPGCCTVEQRARMCVGWREKQPPVKSAWLPPSFSHPKVCGRGGRKAFTACWGKDSLTGQMYLCDEETVTYPRRAGSAVLIKRKENTLLWKKKPKHLWGRNITVVP